MIIGIDHVGLQAEDGAALAKFYMDSLGYTSLKEREVPGMRIFDLYRGDEHLEILQNLNDEVKSRPGWKHVAYRSDDIEAEYAKFKEQGLTLLQEAPQDSEQYRFFFVRSPGGEWFEVVQYK